MPSIEYKLFFGNKLATRDQLDMVEEVTVEQDVDMAWAAHLQIPTCTDEEGNLPCVNEKFLSAFSRVRVEVKVGDGGFLPLIDGPVIGYDSQMSSEPDQSSITLQVQDDSVYLNRQDNIARFDDKLDHEIAEEVFGDIDQIATTDMEKTSAPTGKSTTSIVQRGTEMKILRSLAERQGMHAYVLPGPHPGESIGCFKKFPTKADGLPPLILLGPDRNVESFQGKEDSQSPARVEAFSLSLTDKTVTKSTASFRDLELLGQDTSLEKDDDAAKHIAAPLHSDSVDLDRYVAGLAEKYSYSFQASGKVSGDCYPASLSPYRIVTVQGVNPKQSGDYLINHVTHSLNRDSYSQSFVMKRNARSKSSAGGLADLAGTIF